MVKKQLAAKAASQSQAAADSEQFTFGPAEDFSEPTFTGGTYGDFSIRCQLTLLPDPDNEHDRQKFETEYALYLLRKLEHYSGQDLRSEWDAGNITLASLHKTCRDALAGIASESAPAKDKGKRKATDADEGRTSNYSGASCFPLTL